VEHREQGGSGGLFDIQPNAGEAGAFYASGQTLFGTSNRGNTWTASNHQFPEHYFLIHQIAVHPNVSGMVAVLVNSLVGGYSFITQIGVSQDTGKNWVFHQALSGTNSISFSPTNTNTLYAAVTGKGFAKSLDLGNTWAYSNQGLSNLRVTNIVAVLKPNLLYLSNDSRIYVSENDGINWQNRSTGLPVAQRPQFGSLQSITPDPANGNIVYAIIGGKGIYKTTNAGKQWTLIQSFSDPQIYLSFLTVAPRTRELSSWEDSTSTMQQAP